MKLLHLKVVLAAIDTDESSLDTLRAARELANAAGAKLHVVHAMPADARRDRTAPASAAADAMARLLERSDIKRSEASLEVAAGEPTYIIRSFADKIRADVIILGQHRGRRADQPRLGSTALGVVTNSWAPCLVVSQPMRLPLEHVLVPVDLSNTSRGALFVALSWASALRQTQKGGGAAVSETVALTALFVDGQKREASPQALDAELDRLRRDAGAWAGVGVRGAVVAHDEIPQAIADYAASQPSDLIVLGTRGLGADAVGRLGSVASGVLSRMDTPILLVPPALWENYASTS